MTKPEIKFIVNPAAGGGAVARAWPQIVRRLGESGIPLDYEMTKAAGDAMEIARRAGRQGYRIVVAVGGDGTVNEAANGILDSGSTRTALGVVSAGTAHAFALSLGIPHDCPRDWSWLNDRASVPIDVGVVECSRDGESIRRYFVNEASLGLPAEMVRNWERLPRTLGRGMNLAIRTMSAYGSFVMHRNARTTLQIDRKTTSSRCACIVVANGRYIADGMQLAPHAQIDDGLLDVVTFGDLPKAEIVRMMPLLYSGSHCARPGVGEYKAKTLSVESEEVLTVEIDGESIGESPASFQVLPSALRVARPPVGNSSQSRSDNRRLEDRLFVDA